jgi:hypothetical protein
MPSPSGYNANEAQPRLLAARLSGEASRGPRSVRSCYAESRDPVVSVSALVKAEAGQTIQIGVVLRLPDLNTILIGRNQIAHNGGFHNIPSCNPILFSLDIEQICEIRQRPVLPDNDEIRILVPQRVGNLVSGAVIL